MKKLYIILLFANIFISGSFAQGKKLTSTDTFYKEMLKATGTIHSIESDFRQIKHLDVFDENIESKGRFYYKEGNLVCLNYTQPAQYRIVICGNKIMSETQGSKNTVNLKSNKLMQELQNMLAACMTGDLSKLSGYKLDIYDSISHYTIHVKPESKSLLTYISGFEINVDKKSFSVNKLRINESGANYTDYLFSNQKLNTLKDDKMFTIN